MNEERLISKVPIRVKYGGSAYEHKFDRSGQGYWFGISGPDTCCVPPILVQNKCRSIALSGGVELREFTDPRFRTKVHGRKEREKPEGTKESKPRKSARPGGIFIFG